MKEEYQNLELGYNYYQIKIDYLKVMVSFLGFVILKNCFQFLVLNS